jgi:hypothetical protein
LQGTRDDLANPRCELNQSVRHVIAGAYPALSHRRHLFLYPMPTP